MGGVGLPPDFQRGFGILDIHVENDVGDSGSPIVLGEGGIFNVTPAVHGHIIPIDLPALEGRFGAEQRSCVLDGIGIEAQ
eukprot:CAMPEP_0171322106 /NCGR_PEP_ID=MMETSP0816-20121228/114751_1 /TAXON_ID=420281 /ORGANISM="Proboscia inermis, Strain CCAP1064/1" /LENGTH=79 /DNA_ID=CAMNT_0011820499 /DNA_START=1256 /DNA_END=1495 /DNA_ORIENTATION=-